MREAMMLDFERDPTFRMDDVHDLTRPQIRERIMTRVRRIIFVAHLIFLQTDSQYGQVHYERVRVGLS